jgi:hypothetical protein
MSAENLGFVIVLLLLETDELPNESLEINAGLDVGAVHVRIVSEPT